MKDKEKQKSVGWKAELLNGVWELAFGFCAIAIGFLIAILLPYDSTDDIPFELFVFIGAVVALSIFAFIACITHAIKKKIVNLEKEDCDDQNEDN